MHLEVADRGTGFDGHPDREGYGLRSIRERVHYLGGVLEIERGNPGTRVRLSIPLAS